MTFLTNEQIIILENAIKNHDYFNIQELIETVEEKMKEGILETIIDEFAQAPLVNIASKDEIMRAMEKCENTNK